MSGLFESTTGSQTTIIDSIAVNLLSGYGPSWSRTFTTAFGYGLFSAAPDILIMQMGVEVELAREFPKLYEFCTANEARRPQRDEQWENLLRLARNSEPILNDLRKRGLDLVRLDQYTPPETDRQPLYETILDWLPSVTDPLTLSTCLGRLTEPKARALVKKNRELLLGLARRWNKPEAEFEWVLSVLAQCFMTAAVERDVPEILSWAKDNRLPTEARASYVTDLQRFAKKPGLARDALVDLIKEEALGGAAVWALAGSLKAEALPLLRELRQSSPNERVRRAATATVKKIEARLGRVTLPNASPAELPKGYSSTSIELDTDGMPEFLSSLERGLGGRFRPDESNQLALSANQMKSGQRRFYIVPCSFLDESAVQLGFGFYAEDEDAIVVELHFDARMRAAIDSALSSLMDSE